MHEDLNIADLAGRDAELVMPHDKDLLNYSDDMVEKLFREKYLKCNRSIISDLMFGETKSEIRCDHCNNISKNIEHFLVMPVEVNNSHALLE